MPSLPKLASLWRNLFHRARVENELGEELGSYFEMLVEAKLAQGMTPAEARRLARLEMGGLESVKELVREVRVGRRLEDLGRDLRFGARSLRHSAAFSATVVCSLAVGMAASAAIFSLVNALLLRPLPVPEPERLVMFAPDDGRRGAGSHPPGRLAVFSQPLFDHLRADNNGAGKLFDDLAAEQSGDTPSEVGNRSGDASTPAGGRCVSGNYFRTLGVSPFLGRTLSPDDQTAPGANPVVVLAHHFWKRRFGSDRGMVGSRLTVNGTPYTVVGIAPPGFVGTNVARPADFWVPLTMQVELMRLERRIGRADEWWLLVLGRLARGASTEAAETKVNLALQQFLTVHPGLVERRSSAQALHIALDPGAQGMGTFRRGAREPLLALMAGVGLLLLIVLVNVSHLVLARAGVRRREMNIRTALGATPGRLAQQLAAEALLLSALGAGIALLLTPLLAGGLAALAANLLTLDLSLDGRVLSFVVLLALASTLPLGLLPAWQLAFADPQRELRATGRTFTRSRRRLSRLLVTAQVAISLALLFGAGLLRGTLTNLRGLDKGFEEQHLLLVETNPGLAGLRRRHGPPPEGAAALYDALIARVAALPGVRGAGLSVFGPLSGAGWNHDLTIVGSSSAPVRAQIEGISAGYFEVMGMRLLHGRGFTRADDQHATRVAVINQALARLLFDRSDALGQRLRDVDPGDIEVVGIVRDARTRGVSEPAPPTYFVPLDQQDWLASTLEVRTDGDPRLWADAVRSAVHETHPRLPVLSVRTIQTQIDRALAGERVMALLSAVFALAALGLVCVGLYGVLTGWSAERTAEIGVRVALGATTIGVRWLVLRQALALLVLGLAAGLPLALAVSRVLRSLLYGLAPLDPATLATAMAALGTVALLAAYLPAWRASRIDPMVALRCE